MLLDVWNYFRGYVIIEVTGFSVERFVNLAVHRGVYVWDVKYSGASVRMKVSIAGFKLLKQCAKKTKCRFKIVEKKGYPFMAHKYRKRKLFAAGIVLFVFLMYFMSSFVWLIEINGNQRIENSQLLDFCKDSGLYSGAFKGKIKKKALEQDITRNFKDISFINIKIKGTKATIEIAETLPKLEIIDKTTPCNIVASKDGLITSVYVSTGTPYAKEKDVVSKGDILVSGELLVGDEPETAIKEYVHANAEVRAKLYYELNFLVENTYIQKNFTDNEKTSYSIMILDKEISLFNYSTLYVNYDKIIERTQLKFGEDYPLPIIIVKQTYKEFTPKTMKRSTNEMKQLSEIMVTNRIIREFDFSADIVEKVIEYGETPKGLQIKATITTVEDIGEIQYYNIESEAPHTGESPEQNTINP